MSRDVDGGAENTMLSYYSLFVDFGRPSLTFAPSRVTISEARMQDVSW